MDIGIVGILSFVIAVVMLFAQLKLFSIDSTLKEIRDELRKSNGEAGNAAPGNAPSFTKLGL
jgi:hypothetical protein